MKRRRHEIIAVGRFPRSLATHGWRTMTARVWLVSGRPPGASAKTPSDTLMLLMLATVTWEVALLAQTTTVTPYEYDCPSYCAPLSHFPPVLLLLLQSLSTYLASFPLLLTSSYLITAISSLPRELNTRHIPPSTSYLPVLTATRSSSIAQGLPRLQTVP
ncbi:hypothetical protein HDV57DRAFT_327234 [Trichoderma longibrachiatum]